MMRDQLLEQAELIKKDQEHKIKLTIYLKKLKNKITNLEQTNVKISQKLKETHQKYLLEKADQVYNNVGSNLKMRGGRNNKVTEYLTDLLPDQII